MNNQNYLIKLLGSLFQNKQQTEKKINLLIELDSFDKGGLQKVVLDSALRFDKSKFNVTILSINGGGYLAELARSQGIAVFELPKKNAEKFYIKLLKTKKITLVNSHFSNFGYPIFRKMGIPNVTFIHNVYAFLREAALDSFLENDKYIQLYISVSSKSTDYAVKKLGIRNDKIVTVPNGLILEEHFSREKNAIRISRADFGLNESDYVFINPASYNLHKGHYLMIDAMKKILRQRADIKILCVGNIVYEPHYHKLVDDIKAMGLENHILLPGYFPNVESLYEIVDAFLMPSFIEGWSIAMNEAMFYRKPLIMTDTGGASDVIKNSDIGILIQNEYGDLINLDSYKLDDLAYETKSFKVSDQLAAAMINFAENKEHWRAAGKQGREKIINKYDFEKVVRRYEQIFFNFLDRS